MKLLCALLALSFSLVAQQGPPIDGQLSRWGALSDDNDVIGHYAITTEADAKLETPIYTLTLYDADLQPIGNKTYPLRPTFSVQDAAYNGSHLGVLVYAESGGSVEILDGEANTVGNYLLRDPQRGATGVLYAVGDGFLVVEEYPLKPGNPASVLRYAVEYINTREREKSWNRRFGEPKARTHSTFVKVLYMDEEVLLLQERTEIHNGAIEEAVCTLHAIDPGTGADRFTVNLPTDRPDLAAMYYAAIRTGDQIRVVSHAPDYATKREFYPGHTLLTTYDLSGREVARRPIDLRQGAADPDDRTEFVVQAAEFTPAGELCLLAGSRLRVKKDITFDHDYAFAFEPDGSLSRVLPLNRTPVTVPAYLLGRGGPGLLGAKMEHYQLAQQLYLHRGPFNHALSTRFGGTAAHYLWDRDFSTAAVTYRGLRAVTLRDGSLQEEMVPVSDLGIGWLYPARSGYVLIMQPDAAGQQLVPRLKRLTR